MFEQLVFIKPAVFLLDMHDKRENTHSGQKRKGIGQFCCCLLVSITLTQWARRNTVCTLVYIHCTVLCLKKKKKRTPAQSIDTCTLYSMQCKCFHLWEYKNSPKKYGLSMHCICVRSSKESTINNLH